MNRRNLFASLLLGATTLLGLATRASACATTNKPFIIEGGRPRIVRSAAYLVDAREERLSAHTRVRCAFECAYLCCSEIAESRGIVIDGFEHPDSTVIAVALSALGASAEERETMRELTRWQAQVYPSRPSLSAETGCRIAERIFARTTALQAVDLTRVTTL